MESVISHQSRIANLSDKHCIFRSGDVMFSVPATTVREVTIMPTIVPVPLSHPSLAGIGNLRSEFLPVIDLEPLIGNQARLSADSGQLLVMQCPLGSWAIAIDKVIAIDGIETHIDAGQRNENTMSVLMGTATYDGKVISVLDVNGLQRIAQQTLEDQWHGSQCVFPSTVSTPTSASKWNAV
ncbi:chemotaxis protein CheW [Stieleria sp. ICT_E10.1]|uniref:chemotaxis protein CheW n=1 Tax=Stieleria sedimenti TaxID=2976331 RepID=UPI00217FB950|nr:chemotaxis protein CheW [Stieleria sedimenti]MCS7469305.1 chemotaxis protein CheW [Stieleria sedimenti]